MSKILQLAATLLLTGVTATHAQITSPDKLVAPPPRNPAHAAPRATEDLQWLWQYATPSNKPGLLADARFTALLRDNLKAPQAMWGTGTSLSDAAHAFLDGAGIVASTDNRYLTITGCIVDHCSQRGFLWIDLGQPTPLIVFAALRWNEESKTPDQPNAPFTLWIFPAKQIDAQQLPDALKSALNTWTESRDCEPYQISSAIVVDPNGVPHITGSLEAGVPTNVCTKSPGTHS